MVHVDLGVVYVDRALVYVDHVMVDVNHVVVHVNHDVVYVNRVVVVAHFDPALNMNTGGSKPIMSSTVHRSRSTPAACAGVRPLSDMCGRAKL